MTGPLGRLREAWTIAWKDTVVRFRDRNALLVMLVAPVALSAIMGAALGGLGRGSPPLDHIPIVVVQEDEGELGPLLAGALTSEPYAGLFDVTRLDDIEAARRRVEHGEARAVVHVPRDFTDAVRRRGEDPASPPATVEVLTDPTSGVGAPIADTAVRQTAAGINAMGLGREVALAGVYPYADLLGPSLERFDELLEIELVGTFERPTTGRIALESLSIESGRSAWLDVVAYFAPSLAILFLLFATFDGARSILVEERDGTLARLRATPTSLRAILAGKIGGILVTGALQIAVLVLATRVLFGLHWGASPAGLLLMTVATVAALGGLGCVVVALSKDADQAQTAGSALVMVLAVLGGNLVPASRLPGAIRTVSLLAPNRWAVDGFIDLTVRGLGVREVLPEAGVLAGTAAIFLLVAGRLLHRRLAG